jgi:hypothetical protein
MMGRIARLAPGIAVACLMAAVAQGADLRGGIGGVYRTGSWTPLTVEYAATEAAPEAVAAWVEDPDGQFVRSPPTPVVLEEDGVRRARLQVRFGRPSGRVRLEDVSRGSSAARTSTLESPLPAAETVILVLGDMPAADRATRLLSREDGSRPRVVAIDPRGVAAGAGGLAALGRAARDFDGVDAIVACGRAVAVLHPAVVRGLDEWVRLGGQLVLTAGSSAAEIAGGTTAATAWLPGRVEKLVPLRRSAALEAFARASRPLDKGALAGASVPLFVDPAALPGIVEAFDGRGPAELPLVVRKAHGLGTVAWAGADLDAAPFRDWSGSDTLLVELLRGRRAARELGRFGEASPTAVDLAGQLRQAIDSFPGAKPIPFEVIAGLGALYVACLYPLDWWLVAGGRRRGAGQAPRSAPRFWLSWISLPLLVAGATWLVWSTGQRWKGDAWRTNAAELVDVDAAEGTVRRLAVAGIWSPANAILDVSIRPEGALETGQPPAARTGEAAAGSAVVSWFASSGRGIGATDAAAPHPSLAAVDYRYADGPDRLAGVPIAASSSRLFEAEATETTAASVVASSLQMESQGTLKGTLTSTLPFPLEGCVLAYAGWLYDVGTFRPGESFEPAKGRGPRSLAGALTRRTVSRDRDVAERWNPAEQDPLRILEIAGLHAAAGGRGYTALDAGRLGRFDLSPLVGLDRAVLVGRGPAGVSWNCSPRIDAAAVPPMPTGVTVWRIVIPLVRAPTVAASRPTSPE